MDRKKRLIYIVSMLTVFPGMGVAANLPSTSGSTVPAERESSRLFEFDQVRQSTANKNNTQPVLVTRDSSAEQVSPDAARYRFFLKQINLEGVSLLSEEEIAGYKSKFEGRTVSLAEIYEFIALINKGYADKGYFTCLAILPKQKIAEGVVLVRVIEGKIGKLNVQDNKYTDAKFIKDSLGVKSGDVPKLKETNDTFRVFNTLREPQLDPKFSPGQATGTTDVNIAVKEDKRFSGQVYSDNYGTSQSGEESVGGVFRIASVRGYSDPLTLGVTKGRATESGFINYRHPVGNRGVLNGFSSISKSEVTEYPAASLGINSTSQLSTISYNHVVQAWEPAFVQVKAGFDTVETESYVGIVRTDAVSQRVWAGVDYAAIGKRQEFFATGVVTSARTNTKSFAGDVNDDVVRVNAAASYKVKADNGLYGLYQVKGQATPGKRLPTSEQWSIGGSGSVEPIDTSVVAGDHGWDSRLSLGWVKNNPVPGISKADINIFYGEAVVKSDQNLGLGQNKFKSQGGQINFSLGKDVDVALSVSKGIHLPAQLDSGRKVLGRVSFNF